MNARVEHLAAARSRELLERHPHIEAPLRLQRRLLDRVMLLSREMAGAAPSWTPGLPAGLASRLGQGVPLLRGLSPDLPVAPLRLAFLELCVLLEEGGAGAAARHLGDAVAAGTIDARSLFAASFAREQAAIRRKANHLGVAPDLLWLTAEMTVGPAAGLVRARAFKLPGVAAALPAWARGYCPACGSWPALAEVAPQGRRVLCCSFCGAGWTPAALACVYCGEDGGAFTASSPDPAHPGRRLELCGACGGYLKQVPVEAPTPFPLAALEDLASMDLDEEAMRRGFERKPLPDLGLALTLPGC